jgi:hypothetical protein
MERCAGELSTLEVEAHIPMNDTEMVLVGCFAVILSVFIAVAGAILLVLWLLGAH